MTKQEKIELLKEENKLLKEQIELLKEINELKRQSDIVSVPYISPYYPNQPYYNGDYTITTCNTITTTKMGDAE